MSQNSRLVKSEEELGAKRYRLKLGPSECSQLVSPALILRTTSNSNQKLPTQVTSTKKWLYLILKHFFRRLVGRREVFPPDIFSNDTFPKNYVLVLASKMASHGYLGLTTTTGIGRQGSLAGLRPGIFWRNLIKTSTAVSLLSFAFMMLLNSGID